MAITLSNHERKPYDRKFGQFLKINLPAAMVALFAGGLYLLFINQSPVRTVGTDKTWAESLSSRHDPASRPALKDRERNLGRKTGVSGMGMIRKTPANSSGEQAVENSTTYTRDHPMPANLTLKKDSISLGKMGDVRGNRLFSRDESPETVSRAHAQVPDSSQGGIARTFNFLFKPVTMQGPIR